MTETIARPEAKAAAAWWASKLAGPSRHETGDAESNILTAFAAGVAGQTFSAAEVAAFEKALAEVIEAGLSSGSWDLENPDFGSALRVIANDYGPDRMLTYAAEVADLRLTMFDLPMKTVMWINPGEVSVSEGYGSGEAVVWRAAGERQEQ